MSRPNLRSLDPLAFTKVSTTREDKIAQAPASPLPSLESYKANAIAKALHPAVQHLVVDQVVERGGDAKSYWLTPDREAGTQSLAWFSAGQYLSITLTIQGCTLTRPYSLASSPREGLEGRYMLTIKRAQDGLASNYILDTWTEGTKVTASAPLGEFTYEPLRDARHIVGVAGGSGITPFRSLAKAILEGDEEAASLTLLYGSRSMADALFREEFDAMAAQSGGRFRVIHVLSDVPEEGCEQGFINAALIGKYAPAGEDYSLFLCGPQAMYSFLDKELPNLGLRRKFIRRELFGEYRHPEQDGAYPGARGEGWTLTVRMRGEEKQVPCSAGESLLVSMERAGISAPSRCRSGECGWCRSRLVSGQVYIPAGVDGRRMADRDYGYIHPCSTFPLGDICLDVPPFRA